jgi:hypothetical protein
VRSCSRAFDGHDRAYPALGNGEAFRRLGDVRAAHGSRDGAATLRASQETQTRGSAVASAVEHAITEHADSMTMIDDSVARKPPSRTAISLPSCSLRSRARLRRRLAFSGRASSDDSAPGN